MSSKDFARRDGRIMLLEDIRDLFEERGVDRMASAEIVQALPGASGFGAWLPSDWVVGGRP
jgi:hypothetical protein